MTNIVSRRSLLSAGLLGAATLCAGVQNVIARENEELSVNDSFCLDPGKVRFCLNLGSLRHYNLDLIQELEVARDAGFHSVEIWFDRLAGYARADNGRGFSLEKLRELKKFLDGEGLRVEGAIGFATWIVDDAARRIAGLEELKSQAEALAVLDAPYLAAPASGADHRIEGHEKIAERYRAIIELCEPFGVTPLLELWGMSSTLGKLSDCLAICAATGREEAALLLDVYHLYRGGNSFAALSLIAGSALPILHMNDYPSKPERERLTDADRVFPGDGVAPWRAIMSTLAKNGFSGALSYEVCNRDYRDKYTAVEQSRISLDKMRSVLNSR